MQFLASRRGVDWNNPSFEAILGCLHLEERQFVGWYWVADGCVTGIVDGYQREI